MSQKNKENPVYGTITLSQIVKFIVEIIGKDSLLYFNLVDEDTLNDAYKEKGSYEKYKVNAQDHHFQFTYENSIFGRIYQFFGKLEDEFGISEYHKDLYMDRFVEQFFVQITGIRLFETKNSEIAKSLIFRLQPIVAVNKISGETDFFPYDMYFVEYVSHGSNLNFDNLLCNFCETQNITFEKLYSEVALIARLEEDSVKKAVQRCRKGNILPRWEIFYPLLQFIHKNDDDKKSQTNDFVHLYFYRNFRSAIQHVSVKKELLLEFERLSENFTEYSYDLFYSKYLDVEKNGLHDIQRYAAYFDPLLKKNSIESVKKFHSDFDKLRSELPHSIVFFQNWFCAKDYVYRFMESGNLEELSAALKWYRAAFDDGKYFAGKNLEKFLIEGIAVGFYFEWKNNPKQMRDRILKASDISNLDTKTPIPASIKALYDFAYAFDFVLNEKEDAYNYFYHCRDNFWNTFPPQTKNAEEIRGEDFVEEMGIKVFSGDIHEEIRKTLERVTDKTVNTRIPTDHNVAYTPFSYAIYNCEWTIVEKFLDKTKFPSLDVNVPNTNNSYPICELLTKLKNPILNMITGIMTPANLPENDDIFNELLSRTDKRTFFTQTNHRKVSILQEALETFQMKYIKPVIDKMTDCGKSNFPDDYRITADEVTPLYHAIQLKRRIKTPINEYAKSLDSNEYNMVWKNLAVPGMTEEQKKAYWQNSRRQIDAIPKEYLDIWKKYSDKAQKLIQESGIVGKLEKEFNEAISLLIERTEDVDSFVKHPGDEQKKQLFVTIFRSEYGTLREKIPEEFHQGVNCLLFAAENDDVETCRKLIQAGTDTNRVLGVAPFISNFKDFSNMPNSFVFRCINYKSWKTLKMFLTEFKEKAGSVMHCGCFDITPLVAFIVVSRMEIQQTGMFNKKQGNFSEIDEIIHLFLDCGADMREPTKIGSAEQFMRM